MKRIGFIVLAIATIGVLTGCSTVSETGRTRMMWTSQSSEVALGTNAWTQIIQNEHPSNDIYKINAVERVGENLIATLDPKYRNYNWEFRVFSSATPNAFALPGGKVAIYDSLFQYISNEAELAVVMAHEISHVIARHGGERMSQAAIKEIAQNVIGRTVSDSELLRVAYCAVADLTLILPYSRAHESEADLIGLNMMARAGYDPRAAIKFWQKFSQAGGTGVHGVFFSTHPTGAARIDALNRNLNGAITFYNVARPQYGLGNSLK